jgi:hypothetical protein
MNSEDYRNHILLLAQKWRMNLITEIELKELENWYRALEDKDLGMPLEISVEKMEKRLHELFTQKIKSSNCNANSPPYPL